MLVLSSPSGAGKTSISRALLARERDLSMSVSVTTRPKRPGEVAGSDYHFVDTETFGLMVNRGELLEHAKVFGNYYGTPRVVAERMAKAADEMSHWPEYDYVLVNDDLAASTDAVIAILAAERLRRERQTGLGDFVKSLREGR
jgi:guanylate kinase